MGHLGKVRGDELEGRGAMAHRVLVDFCDSGKVGVFGEADIEGGHGAKIAAERARSTFFRHARDKPGHDSGKNGRQKQKAPARRPGLDIGFSFRSISCRAVRATAAAA
jgi:hypothetical protein